ncbi:hypothetical protein DSO57_1020173 [Entomophthora muscae]|uniref:Uncharacterized protein n=2 Tax=Entomophthora muscae TaxID=34485 RepID=A0ACC2RHS1_9FUNG|nr:hypothetical protein DSO57_1022826 [Entomophthora muscae]KAJ9057700.1 hypothetical protein DSO57_1020173 [Entomophthora muscae]
MEFITPRIVSSQINAYQGLNVRIVGIVKQQQGNGVLLETTDRGQVTVHITQPAVYCVNDCIEVVGKVQNGEILEQMSYNLGPGLDFESYNQAIDRFSKAPHLFS